MDRIDHQAYSRWVYYPNIPIYYHREFLGPPQEPSLLSRMNYFPLFAATGASVLGGVGLVIYGLRRKRIRVVFMGLLVIIVGVFLIAMEIKSWTDSYPKPKTFVWEGFRPDHIDIDECKEVYSRLAHTHIKYYTHPCTVLAEGLGGEKGYCESLIGDALKMWYQDGGLDPSVVRGPALLRPPAGWGSEDSVLMRFVGSGGCPGKQSVLLRNLATDPVLFTKGDAIVVPNQIAMLEEEGSYEIEPQFLTLAFARRLKQALRGGLLGLLNRTRTALPCNVRLDTPR